MPAPQNLPPPRGFPDAEFETRLTTAQNTMAVAKIDALLLTTEADIRYYSGFATQFWQSPTRPWFLVVPTTGKPVAVIPGIGAECMARTWIEDIRTWSSPHPHDDGISLLASTLREVAGKTGRIGLPMAAGSHLRLPLADFEKLRHCLRNMEFVDATGIIQFQRMQKSELEISKISYVCSSVSAVFATAAELFSIGQSDIDAFRSFKTACLAHGVDDISYLVGGAGAGGYNDIISPPSGRLLAHGDILMLDTGCTFDGYFCDFDRNFALGAASDQAPRAYRVLFEATEAALNIAVPGTTCAQLFHAMHKIIDASGVLDSDVGRLGHGLGLQLTEPPSHTAFDHTVLKPGMVITLEPGLTFAPGKTMVHEENIVIRETGAELLTTRAPPELPIIG